MVIDVEAEKLALGYFQIEIGTIEEQAWNLNWEIKKPAWLATCVE